MTDATAGPPPQAPQPRKPRKIFLVVGLVLAVGLGIGLFTSVGTKKNTGPPQQGGPVPSFSAPRLNGSGTVAVPGDGGGGGTPAVLLFFGNWCHVCHAEMPPLAAAVQRELQAGGTLAKVHVIGVDSEDSQSVGQNFVRVSGIEFPVARDPQIGILSGDFYFDGDPNAVFVRGNGTISAIVSGPISVAKFTAEEKELIPSET
jgi:thiol-disulfide isomerase/thioredoxin